MADVQKADGRRQMADVQLTCFTGQADVQKADGRRQMCKRQMCRRQMGKLTCHTGHPSKGE